MGKLQSLLAKNGLRVSGTRTVTQAITPRRDTPRRCERKEVVCTWSETLGCRKLSGPQGAVSREKSMVMRLERAESAGSSASVKKCRTLTECLRTKFSICHSRAAQRGRGGKATELAQSDLSVTLLQPSGDLWCAGGNTVT